MPKPKKCVNLDALAFKFSRKKNCRLIIKINLLITILWTILNGGILYLIMDRTDTINIFTHEAHLLKDNQMLSFQQCRFSHHYFSTPFDMTRCSDECGTKAISWRIRSLHQPFARYSDVAVDRSKGKHHMCLDQLDHVNCHDNHTTCQPPPKQLHECAGVAGTGVEGQISYGYPVLAPAIKELDLRKVVGRNLLAAELIVKCPICRIQSDWFKVDGEHGDYQGPKTIRCMAKVATIAFGWPRIAEFCDNTVVKNKDFDDCFHFNDKVDIIDID